MREIKFRGKSINNKEWVYGSIVHQTDYYGTNVDRYFIIDGTTTQDYDIGDNIEISPQTIGQYTGLKDENGNEIYEGDYIKMHFFFENCNPITLGVFEDEKEVKGVVICDINGFYIETNDNYYPLSYMEDSEAQAKVIGNIYDNPELLKGENNDR